MCSAASYTPPPPPSKVKKCPTLEYGTEGGGEGVDVKALN